MTLILSIATLVINLANLVLILKMRHRVFIGDDKPTLLPNGTWLVKHGTKITKNEQGVITWRKS